MKADAWGREAAWVCTHQWWPLSLVTDYRSLMLPQRPPRLVEMNHPSAFFCKPSITSDSSPQTPPPHPPATTSTDSQCYTLEEDAAKYLVADELCWRISPRGRVPPPRHVPSCSSTSLPFPSHSFPPFSCTTHQTLHQHYFFCHLLLFLDCSFPHFWSSCPPTSTVHHHPRSLCHRSVSVSLGISLPAISERANHCWHFKRPCWWNGPLWRRHLFSGFSIPADVIICLLSRQLGGQVSSWWQASVTSISLIRLLTLLTALTILPPPSVWIVHLVGLLNWAFSADTEHSSPRTLAPTPSWPQSLPRTQMEMALSTPSQQEMKRETSSSIAKKVTTRDWVLNLGNKF